MSALTVREIRSAKTMQALIDMRERAENQVAFAGEAAQAILNSDSLLKEVIEKPERLIECLFFVVDKHKKTVPFRLNAVQRNFIDRLNTARIEYAEGKRNSLSFLVLKGRQQGFTTLITAYQMATAMTHRNFEGLTMADDANNAQVIFDNKAKFVFDKLPDSFKHTTKYNNRRELRFEKINSYLSVDVATKHSGRSRTINFFHGSECAFWKDGIATIQSGLGEALTADCIKIYESTANGFNDYREMWESGAHENMFFEWWHTAEYVANPPQGWTIADDEEWISKRLRMLKAIGLSDEQLYWYYEKWRGYIDKELIKQEYPCSAEEAFLSSGRPVFDLSIITERIRELAGIKTVSCGFGVVYRDADARDVVMNYTRFDEGPVIVYQEPIERVPYVLGGDTAGEGSDAYTAYVLRNDTGEQVASLHMPLNSADCVPYVEQIIGLGMYYNDALIAPEINFNLQVVAELQRLRYKNIYVRTRVETYKNQSAKQFGFKTDGNTRPMILSLFASVISDNAEWIKDAELLRECLSFEYDEKGRPDARPGTHDDRIFAAAIAYKAREQQSYGYAEAKKTVFVPRDIYDDYRRADEETKVMIEERYDGIPRVRSDN